MLRRSLALALRFGLEAALAVVYGSNILSWLDADLFHDIVTGWVLLTATRTTLSLVKMLRTSGRPKARRVPA